KSSIITFKDFAKYGEMYFGAAQGSNELAGCDLRVSYSFRYGVLIRLALTIGIRLGELLALRWDDLGPNNTLIINKTITSLPMSFDNGSVEKPGCFRLITLPMNVVCELCKLRNAQYTDITESLSRS
ncbi:MAG TPA: hypothetical protein PLH98_04090, partial [Ruminococcus flavefaciens]|nr:hypothetical protein [Ruminococcus flavefaciens]